MLVRLLAEVEVRDQRVFEQMHATVSGQQQRRGPVRIQRERLGQHLQQRGGQHKARTQRDEVAQRTRRGRAPHQQKAAKVVGEPGEEAKRKSDPEARCKHQQ